MCRMRTSLQMQHAFSTYLLDENASLQAALHAVRQLHDERFAADAHEALMRLLPGAQSEPQQSAPQQHGTYFGQQQLERRHHASRHGRLLSDHALGTRALDSQDLVDTTAWNASGGSTQKNRLRVSRLENGRVWNSPSSRHRSASRDGKTGANDQRVGTNDAPTRAPLLHTSDESRTSPGLGGLAARCLYKPVQLPSVGATAYDGVVQRDQFVKT